SLAFSPFFPFITSLYRFIYFSTSLTVTSIPELLNLLFIIIFEVVIEAIKGDKKAFVSEVADELYHLFVLMHALGVDFSEIEA
ncbi:phosphoribosyl-ATP pyrophosphatase, partial [Staphylococcus sp. EG-SA-21]|uniref:phosphoribosyl-ATP pyrophosphatase n=1 Tax=Staphylococcus sp. EG-SA-21 TaxID=2767496 RepID=UPI003208D41F